MTYEALSVTPDIFNIVGVSVEEVFEEQRTLGKHGLVGPQDRPPHTLASDKSGRRAS